MTVALIVAAGSGERLGADRPKAFVELAGRPLVQWSIDALREVAGVERIVVAIPPGVQPPPGVIAVQGGAVRSDSVRRALAAAGEGDLVLVHDAARPLLSSALAEAVIAALAPSSRRSSAASCGRCRRRRSFAAPRSRALSRRPSRTSRARPTTRG